jgi:hypothetical protein
MTAVKWTELIDAYEWASFGDAFDNAAFVDLDTGAVLCTSESQEMDDEVPDDLEESDRYLPLPTKTDLDLGKRLALAFAGEQIPEHYERVAGYFRKAGAYSRFKDLLADRGKLEAWYAFEQAAKERALRAWCTDNEIELIDAPAI